MLTVLDVIQRTSEFFGGKGVESPRLNAELVIGHGLGLKRMQLYLQFERLLTEAELERIRPLVRRRGAREPLQYVVGETDFAGLKLKVDRRALIPRPETERLIELTLERAKPVAGVADAGPPGAVLDLGTGTGAIALALAAGWPQARVTAVDTSEEALALAGENAKATGLADRVTFLRSDWFSALPPSSRFDAIVANPPYLSAEETAAAAPEVKAHEPHQALTAPENGLAAIRTIVALAKDYLTPIGWLALETGPDQHPAIEQMAKEAGWPKFQSLPDLTGRPRFVFLSLG